MHAKERNGRAAKNVAKPEESNVKKSTQSSDKILFDMENDDAQEKYGVYTKLAINTLNGVRSACVCVCLFSFAIFHIC